MQRRDLLRAAGAAAAVALLPGDAAAIWSRIASGLAVTDGLSPEQLALIGAIGDTILPRTTSPSATDVGVPKFIDVIVNEQYAERDRRAFMSGLDTIAAQLRSADGTSFVAADPAARERAVAAIESLTDHRTDPARTWWRLKGLVIHGYFTSERVMKDVLHTEIMPGHFDGNAPMRAS